MSDRAMWAIAVKDMKAIRNSVQVWLPMVIVPIFMCVLIPAGLILGIRYYGAESLRNMGNIEPLFRVLQSLPPGSLKDAILAWDTVEQQVLYFTLNYLFVPLFLLVPLMASSVITANSFVIEKERKTLESLLFSPVGIPSLFKGKILSAFIPSMGLTMLCALLYGLVVDILAYPVFGKPVFPTMNWLILVFWAIPALTLFAIFFNVVISAKVKGFQEAYQLGGLLVLPVLALVLSQALGVLIINPSLLWWIGGGVLVVDLVFIRFIGRYFDRNKLFESQVS